MAETDSILRKVSDFAMSSAGMAAAFVYLAALSALSTILVVAVLTAHQFQHAIQTTQIDGKPIAIWKVIELRDKWKEGTDRARLELESNQVQHAELLKELASIQDELAVAKSARDKNEFAVSDSGRLLMSKFAEAGLPVPTAIYPMDTRFSVEMLQVLNGDNSVDQKQKDELKKLVKDHQLKVAEAFQSELPAKRLFDRKDTLEERLPLLADSLKRLGIGLEGLLEGETASDKELLANFLSQLNALDSAMFGWIKGLATTEPDLLTLFLVLAMGILGGTIHLAQLYLSGAATSVGYFLFRPFLGAITALVVFVVARTGVFVVSEPMQNNSSPISPFFISFLAIISGLLAERALESVQGIGANWFSQPIRDKTARYPIRLADLTKPEEMRSMAQFAGLSEKEVDELLEGRKPVSADIQRVVATWVKKPVREIFSDIPS
jgi:hypothetical protein